jgi:hypothetical protein
MIWDSAAGLDEFKKSPINSYIKLISGSDFILNKIIPKSFFVDAVLPVSTDITFYPDAGTGGTTVDGYIRGVHAAWATARLQAGAHSKFDTDTTIPVFTQKAANYVISRSGTYFDTGSISSGSTITGASLEMYVTLVDNGDNDGDDFLAVIQIQGNNIVSDSSLAIADYQYFVGDTLDNPTEGHDSGQRKDITNVSTGVYLSWTLNSTGIEWIAKSGQQKPTGGTAGITYLGTREGHDIINSAIAASSLNRVIFSSADESGTSQDPRLVVTLEAPSILIPKVIDLFNQMGRA